MPGYDHLMLPRRRTARALAALFGVLSVLLVLAALLPTHLDRALGWMPLLLLAEVLYIACDPPRRLLVRLCIAGLLVMGAADAVRTLAAGHSAALVMALYLVGMSLWCVALWPLREESFLSRQRGALVPYGLLVAVAMFGAVSDGVDAVAILGLLYLAVAVALAVLSSSLGLTGAFGGASFFLAHTLTAMAIFVPAWDRPGIPAWIAALYLGGAGLLAAGVLRWDASGRTATATSPRVYHVH